MPGEAAISFEKGWPVSLCGTAHGATENRGWVIPKARACSVPPVDCFQGTLAAGVHGPGLGLRRGAYGRGEGGYCW